MIGDNRVGSGGSAYARAIESLGHVCLHVPSFDYTPLSGRFRYRVYRRAFRSLPSDIQSLQNSFIRSTATSYRPHIVIILKGLTVPEEEVKSLREMGAWVCLVNHDDFFSRNNANWNFLQRKALKSYDYIFTTRNINVEEVKSFNPNVEFFPFSFDPSIHRPPTPDPPTGEQWLSDVVFVGAFEKDRAQLLKSLIRSLGHDFKIHIHGPQWSKARDDEVLRSAVKSERLGPAEMAKVIYYSKISLGFLRKANRDDYTQRSLEIPAIGGLLLAERTAQHANMFVEGIEAEFFNPDSNEELTEKCTQLLRNPSKLLAMRIRGQNCPAPALWATLK